MIISSTSHLRFNIASRVIFMCLLFCGAAFGEVDEESRSWNQPVKPYRVIGNVYYVGATEVSSFLIVTPKGHILLDSGFQETEKAFREQLKRQSGSL